MAKHKIMVVDDEPMVSDVLALFLTKNGYEVTCFANGKQALECLKTNQFSLLITDVNMPEMSGPELIKLAREITPNLPVMVMTGTRDEKTDTEIAKLDIKGYFPKPFDFDCVARSIAQTLTTLLSAKNSSYEISRLKECSDRFVQ